MSEQPTETPAPRVASATRRWQQVWPYALTALVTLGLALAIQLTLLRPTSPTIVLPTRAPTVAPPQSSATATAPTPVASGEVPFIRQELADLRAGQEQLWSAVYLSRALNQIAEAEATLRVNDFAGTDQALIAADDSLVLAYARADASVQSPIERLRREIDVLRDDLFLYPEQMDQRLTGLRQLVLTLIEQRG